MSVALAEDGSCPYDASCPGERRAAVAGTTQHRCWFVWPGNGDRAIVCYHRRRLARQPQKAYMRERNAGMNVKLMCWKRTGTYDVNLLWCINALIVQRRCDSRYFLTLPWWGSNKCVVFTRRSWTAPLEVLNIIQHFVCRIDNMSNSMAGYRIDYSVANLSNEVDGATQVPSTVAPPPLQSGVVTRDCASSACINSHGSNNWASHRASELTC